MPCAGLFDGMKDHWDANAHRADAQSCQGATNPDDEFLRDHQAIDTCCQFSDIDFDDLQLHFKIIEVIGCCVLLMIVIVNTVKHVSVNVSLCTTDASADQFV